MLIELLSWWYATDFIQVMADNKILQKENFRLKAEIIKHECLLADLKKAMTAKRELTSFICKECKKTIFTDERYMIFDKHISDPLITKENPSYMHCGCYHRMLHERETQ